MSTRLKINHIFDTIEAIETEIWRSVTRKSSWVGQKLYKGAGILFDHYDQWVWHPIFWVLVLIVLAVGTIVGSRSFYAAFVVFSICVLLIEWVRGRMEV